MWYILIESFLFFFENKFETDGWFTALVAAFRNTILSPFSISVDYTYQKHTQKTIVQILVWKIYQKWHLLNIELFFKNWKHEFKIRILNKKIKKCGFFRKKYSVFRTFLSCLYQDNILNEIVI